MLLEAQKSEDPRLYSPLVLAYLGDAVLELLVRDRLVRLANRPVGQLHRMTVERVCAAAQSAAVERLLPVLDEEETAVYKRGRNANGSHVPKNADPQEYRRATGLEALFGYLFLKGEAGRIEELFAMIWQD